MFAVCLVDWGGGPGFWELVVDDYEVIVVLYNEAFWVLFRMLDVQTETVTGVETSFDGLRGRFWGGFWFLYRHEFCDCVVNVGLMQNTCQTYTHLCASMYWTWLTLGAVTSPRFLLRLLGLGLGLGLLCFCSRPGCL